MNKKFIFKLLIERLKWPDMLVLEKTFHAIKKFLLVNPSFKSEFLEIIKNEELEINVVELLLIVFLVNKEKAMFFTFEEIDKSIYKPSLLSELYIKEIFNINLDIENREWKKNYLKYDYSLYKEASNIEINSLIEKEIEKLNILSKNNIPIEEHFNCEYLEFKRLNGQCVYSGKFDYFCNTEYLGYANVFLSKNKVQISAYLRTIAFLFDMHGLPLEYAIDSVYNFLPVDMGLLSLQPTVKPTFIENLIENNTVLEINNFVPVYISCPLKYEIGIIDKKIISIDIFPVYMEYEQNTIEKYFNMFRYEIPKKMLQIQQALNIETISIPEDIPNYFIGLFHRCYNYIQRLYAIERELFIPNETDLNIKIEDDKIYFQKQDIIIGYSQYWYDNYNSYTYKDTTPCTGVITYFHKDYINKLLNYKPIYLLRNMKAYKNNRSNNIFEIIQDDYDMIKIEKETI